MHKAKANPKGNKRGNEASYHQKQPGSSGSKVRDLNYSFGPFF